jgi:hypothetical protein
VVVVASASSSPEPEEQAANTSARARSRARALVRDRRAGAAWRALPSGPWSFRGRLVVGAGQLEVEGVVGLVADRTAPV